MVGTASRNENSTMAARDQPSDRPPRMVAALRETPGMTATDCARPMTAACFSGIFARSSCGTAGGRWNFSNRISTTPPRNKAIGTTAGVASR